VGSYSRLKASSLPTKEVVWASRRVDGRSMRNKKNTSVSASARHVRLGLCGAFAALAAIVLPATALGVTANDQTQFSVSGTANPTFTTAPDVPNLPALTLTGDASSQTVNGQMANFAVRDATGTAAGWNVTVVGDNAALKSPYFRQYCPNATCGSDSSGPGYIGAGYSLNTSGTGAQNNALSLSSSGLTNLTAQNGSTGTAPTHQCSSGCFVDAAVGSPVKVVSAATSAGMGTWQGGGYGASSLALSAPTTTRVLQTNEYYRVDLVWTLNTGP
jgi:hypothetical protein